MYGGVHFPNGPEGDFFNLPPTITVMLAGEARWHYADARDKGWAVIWRAVPRVGHRPAELNWDVPAVAQECLRHWDEQPHDDGDEEFFMPLNELDLNGERGDSENDFENQQERYAKLGNFLYALYYELTDLLPSNVSIVFPAWTPDHDALKYVDEWRDAALTYDIIAFHAYGNAETLVGQYEAYLDTFPHTLLVVTEWHDNNGNPDEIGRCIERLSDLYHGSDSFMGACYFTYHWYDPPGWWPGALNLDENPGALDHFMAEPDAPPEIKKEASWFDEMDQPARYGPFAKKPETLLESDEHPPFRP